MRNTHRKSISLAGLATALLLIASIDSQPTLPSAFEGRAEPPSPEEVQVLDELLVWVEHGPQVLEVSSSVTRAVLSRPRSFDLFRTYNKEEDRRQLLEGVPYGDLIRKAARRHRLDGLLIAAVMEAESGFDPMAVSTSGAFGLMQVMPDTARLFGREEFHEPAVNVDVGARYLSWLLSEFNGDVALAVAAYNAGPGNVSRFDGVPPFGETRHYLERVLARYVDHHQRLWRQSGAQTWLNWDRAARTVAQTGEDRLLTTPVGPARRS